MNCNKQVKFYRKNNKLLDKKKKVLYNTNNSSITIDGVLFIVINVVRTKFYKRKCSYGRKKE